jgi:hypothetical protein
MLALWCTPRSGQDFVEQTTRLYPSPPPFRGRFFILLGVKQREHQTTKNKYLAAHGFL